MSDANFSHDLLELKLNWAESMDKLDYLLDFDVISLASLAMSQQERTQKVESKTRFHTLAIEDILPDHSVRYIAN